MPSLRGMQLGVPTIDPSYISLYQELGFRTIWPLTEESGSQATDYSGNDFHGVYGTVELANSTFLTGEPYPLFSGADHVNVYSAGFASGFDPEHFTLNCWIRPTDWAGGTTRRIFSLRATAQNWAVISKDTNANRLVFTYIAGNVSKSVPVTISALGDHMLTLTVDKTADEMKAYVDGVQQGSTQTGLGTWSGSLDSTLCMLGNISAAGAGPYNGHAGYFGQANRALSATEVARLYHFLA